MSKLDWFVVDRDGLRRLTVARGPEIVALEMLQNALDAPGSTRAEVTVEALDGSPFARVTVEDDGAGFTDLSHAWTLFAPSVKGGDATLRGRFNLGEKLVLSLARSAVLTTTSGCVHFADGGRRTATRPQRAVGTLFSVEVRMTRAEQARCRAVLRRCLPPAGRAVLVDGLALLAPTVIATASATLPTVVTDADGNLRPVSRRCSLRVVEPTDDTGAWLYELGLPVVPLPGDRWSVDVGQKVPLTLARDNVPPSFLRQVRAAVLNATAQLLRPCDGSEGWVRDAAGAREVTAEAYRAALTARFGAERVMDDLSDPEATHRAGLANATVVRGNQLSADERANLRRFRAAGEDPLPAAGRVPQYASTPLSGGVLLSSTNWTHDERVVHDYACAVWEALNPGDPSVRVALVEGGPFEGTFGVTSGIGPSLSLRVRNSAPEWVSGRSGADLEALHRLLLHEYAHATARSHLGVAFAEAGFRLGARLAGAIFAGVLRPGDHGWDTSPLRATSSYSRGVGR